MGRLAWALALVCAAAGCKRRDVEEPPSAGEAVADGPPKLPFRERLDEDFRSPFVICGTE